MTSLYSSNAGKSSVSDSNTEEKISSINEEAKQLAEHEKALQELTKTFGEFLATDASKPKQTVRRGLHSKPVLSSEELERINKEVEAKLASKYDEMYGAVLSAYKEKLDGTEAELELLKSNQATISVLSANPAVVNSVTEVKDESAVAKRSNLDKTGSSSGVSASESLPSGSTKEVELLKKQLEDLTKENSRLKLVKPDSSLSKPSVVVAPSAPEVGQYKMNNLVAENKKLQEQLEQLKKAQEENLTAKNPTLLRGTSGIAITTGENVSGASAATNLTPSAPNNYAEKKSAEKVVELQKQLVQIQENFKKTEGDLKQAEVNNKKSKEIIGRQNLLLKSTLAQLTTVTNAAKSRVNSYDQEFEVYSAPDSNAAPTYTGPTTPERFASIAGNLPASVLRRAQEKLAAKKEGASESKQEATEAANNPAPNNEVLGAATAGVVARRSLFGAAVQGKK